MTFTQDVQEKNIRQFCFTGMWGNSNQLLEKNLDLGRFPFVRTDRLDPSSRNENFTVNQNYPAMSVISWIEKCRFHFQTDWSGNGPASQFWQMETALSLIACATEDLARATERQIPGTCGSGGGGGGRSGNGEGRKTIKRLW